MTTSRLLPFLALLIVTTGAATGTEQWPFAVTDLSQRTSLTILVFGDAGTGREGQARVGLAMFDVCRQRQCDLAVMLGDVMYENGVEIDERTNAEASLQEILGQFENAFERPYRAFSALPGFHFWVSLGNHDYEDDGTVAMVTYSEFSDLWRLPALHYEVGGLPDWIQLQAAHTDTEERRDLNGLQVASLRRQLCDESRPERWKILFGHQPVYNSGHHRNDSDERRARSLLEPLLVQCGVHLYLAGHAHHQEHLTVRGFEQIIQGAAGKSKGSNNRRLESHVQQRYFSKTFGFAVIDIDAERVRVDFYDVLNTREKADRVAAPTPDEIVRSYSWCADRNDIGRPDVATAPCPAAR